MTNDRLPDQMRELNWRQKLTDGERAELRAWLSAHPEAQADWEAETSLSEVLGRLPDVPVATNFTARVLQTAALEAGSEQRRETSRWQWWHRQVQWVPKVAFTAIALSVGLFSYRYVQHVQRAEMVEGVEVVSQVASLPSPEILKDFDAICALDQTPSADEELLRLLQ